jgi:hypothetical protein
MKFVQPIRDTEKIYQIKNILKKQSYRNYFLFVLGINQGIIDQAIDNFSL